VEHDGVARAVRSVDRKEVPATHGQGDRNRGPPSKQH
jgi:hypothetical protein